MTADNELILDSPEYFYNRELSWLDFNKRVIDESIDPANPLLERLNFLAISSSNLDEFFMVRVAGLLDQNKNKPNKTDNKTKMNAEQQLYKIAKTNQRNVELQYQSFQQRKRELQNLGISFVEINDLNGSEKELVDTYFKDTLLPNMTPFFIDNDHSFPNLRNKGMYFYVTFFKNDSNFAALIPIPTFLDRYFLLEEKNEIKVLLIEQIIQYHIHRLFPAYTVSLSFLFRPTKNQNIDIFEENSEDFISNVEDHLKQLDKRGVIRLEIQTPERTPLFSKSIDFLLDVLSVNKRELYTLHQPLDLTFLNQLSDTLGKKLPEHVFPAFSPIISNEFSDHTIFDLVKSKDVFLHHPYDSFQPVVQFIREAAQDKNTISIKQTLYRVSSHSPIVAALKDAAKNGILVTVLVELKARFDEKNNLAIARELEESGVFILYGKANLKTHSKITMVVRKEDNQMTSYVHLGTGNYNEKTASGYEDMGIITKNEEIVEDATKFFNYLSGYSGIPTYNQLMVSPYEIRNSFLAYIDKEIVFHQKTGKGYIIAKMNSLSDKPLILKLYEASQMGVKIDLIVRGICSLKPGIPGISENIKVISIVGRFLEHSRVYYFNHNNQHKLYLSSADWMRRNMSNRVEIAFPILDSAVKEEILSILSIYLSDNQKARQLGPNGDYHYIKDDLPSLSAQSYFIQQAQNEKQLEMNKNKNDN